MTKDQEVGNGESRSDFRAADVQGGSIEFRPSEDAMVYQFSLRDWSSSGLGILVRNDSEILTHIRVGQVISFKVHRAGGNMVEDQLEAEIRHISEPEEGQHPDHKIVGLHILGTYDLPPIPQTGTRSRGPW